MKNFIEVTLPEESEKIILNTVHIFAIEPYFNKFQENCEIKVAVMGFSGYPFQFYRVTETYEEVVKLIEAAQ